MALIPTARSRLSGQTFGNAPLNRSPSSVAARIAPSTMANHSMIPVGRPAGGADPVAYAQPHPTAAPAGNSQLGNAMGGGMMGVAGPMPTATAQPVTAPRPFVR